MFRKLIIIITTLILITSCSSNKISKFDTQKWETVPNRTPSIHDPSIVVDEKDGEKTYYIFGTHISQAKSLDLTNWQVPKRNNGYVNMHDNIIFGNTRENLKETFEWAGYDDADSKNGYNLWAPDVLFNPHFEWKDGTKGAYMYYYSASSTWRRSAIGFMVSPDIEGPYRYAGTVIYSGFTKEDATDGSERNINYKNTHIPELINSGQLSEFNDKWVRKLGKEYNTDYAPNAIDPALVWDKDGKLWMVYGSWSGGIFLLEIDPSTGHPIYPKEDSTTDDGRTIDRYFGIKLAGGYHKSGEGPYIVYHPGSDYYYLYVTYGGLASDGGYNMRVFRSKEITGPYVDAKGHRPLFQASDINDLYGIKVMGNYYLDGMRSAYKSPGHNSVLIDADRNFLVFHTRYNNQGEQFNLKIHEMKMNDNGWFVVLPYEYNSEYKLETVDLNEVVGTYSIVNHGISTSGNMLETKTLVLKENGKISGEYNGTWEKKDDFIHFKIDGIDYSGVIYNQQINKDRFKIVFSLVGDDNTTIFGSKDN